MLPFRLCPNFRRPRSPAGAAPLPLVEARGLIKEYARAGGVARVVDDVSFAIQPGETLGLVGESGCGKTTVARILLRLIEPTAGDVLFEGQPLPPASSAAMRALRRRMQIVFQDPYAALNPRMTVSRFSPSPSQSTANRRGRPARAPPRTAPLGRPRRIRPAALSARVLRRPAPAHQHRPRPGPAPALPRPRRAGQLARRLGRRADHQPAARAATQARPHLSLHLPLHASGAILMRPRRRHAARPPGGARRLHAGLRLPRSPYTRQLIAATPELPVAADSRTR